MIDRLFPECPHCGHRQIWFAYPRCHSCWKHAGYDSEYYND